MIDTTGRCLPDAMIDAADLHLWLSRERDRLRKDYRIVPPAPLGTAEETSIPATREQSRDPTGAPSPPEPEAVQSAPSDTAEQHQSIPLGIGSVAEFTKRYIEAEKGAGRAPTQKGLIDAWKKGNAKGHREQLRNQFKVLMGNAARGRGRPPK